MNSIFFEVSGEEAGRRIDVFLSEKLNEFSRSYIQKCLKDELIKVNKKNVSPNYKLKKSDEICFIPPQKEELSALPQNIPLEILYEDDDLLVVNKPKGMVVHPAAGHSDGTLVNALLYHCEGKLSGINGVLRPGIVHRIDKDTTGALLVCKSDAAHKSLAEQLAVHSIRRKYRAIVIGTLHEKEFRIETTIGRHSVDRKKMAAGPPNGKRAITDVKVLDELNGYTYIECTLHTGRTHQIRVHMASIGRPVLGDEVYGPKRCPIRGLTGQTLHAYMIGFVHPIKNEYMEIYAPIPEYIEKLLIELSRP